MLCSYLMDVYLVSEYISGGELTTLLEKYHCLPEELVRIYVAELALALGTYLWREYVVLIQYLIVEIIF